MSELINIYCDESCHLEHDHIPVMLLGAIWAPKEQVKRLAIGLRDIKVRHHAEGELKWSKVSKSRQHFFLEVVEWFFAEAPLHFRALIVPNKSVLDHGRFNNGSHDTFYYKMYFSLLNKIFSPDCCYDVYLDIKDTRSNLKVKKLHDVLCNDQYDFTHSMIRTVQQIRSHESELLQLGDFLLGALAYKHRGLDQSDAKLVVIKAIEKYRPNLLSSTPRDESKFNIFVWQPRSIS